jgi:hypothetical protein
MPGETLEQLEERPWGTPDFDSGLVSICHLLRTKPISEFTIADLQILIGQRIGLPHLVPRALDILEEDPLAEGDYFSGDLLMSVIRADSFLVSRPELLERLLGVVEKALDRFGADDEQLRCDLTWFISRHRPDRQQIR